VCQPANVPRSPLWKPVLERQLAHQPLKRTDARLVFPRDARRGQIGIELASLRLGGPNADQVTGNAVPLGKPVQRLAGPIFLNNLPLELNRISAPRSHGLSPRKPGPHSPILTSSPVHPQGQSKHLRRFYEAYSK
jgi:hypothetical protein